MTTPKGKAGIVLPPPGFCASVHPRTVSAREGARDLGLRALFVVVVALLAADLHSSWAASPATWESNPVVDALGEAIGKHAALVAVKLADAGALFVLYALWRRSRAHGITACVLAIVAVHYASTVFNNYLS